MEASRLHEVASAGGMTVFELARSSTAVDSGQETSQQRLGFRVKNEEFQQHLWPSAPFEEGCLSLSYR